MKTVALSSIDLLLKLMAFPVSKSAVLPRTSLARLSYVSHVFLTSNLDGFPICATFPHSQGMQTFRCSLSFYRYKYTDDFLHRNMDGLDVVFGMESTDIVPETCWSGIIAMSSDFFFYV